MCFEFPNPKTTLAAHVYIEAKFPGAANKVYSGKFLETLFEIVFVFLLSPELLVVVNIRRGK